jgi:hypothetical protein
VLAFLLPPSFVQGHPLGIIRLRDARGPFAITLFTSPELISGRAADVSMLIQKRDSNEAVLDAIVSFVLTPPRSSIQDGTEAICGQPGLATTMGSQDGQTTILARREQSLNKLVYTAPVNFHLAGAWELKASVRHGTDSAKFSCEIPVDLPARPLAGLVPFLALPILLVTLFAINQWLRTPYQRK